MSLSSQDEDLVHFCDLPTDPAPPTSRDPGSPFAPPSDTRRRTSETPPNGANVLFVGAGARFGVPRRIAQGVASSADIIHALLHADDESAVIGGMQSLVELLDAAIATDDAGAKAVLVSQAAERASVVLFLARQERRDLEGGA